MSKKYYKEFSVNQPLAEELESERTFGTEIDENGWVARIAEQPIGFLFRNICEKLGHPVKGKFSLYDNFDLWFIPHRLSIVRHKGFSEVTSIGLEVEYIHNDATCSIVSLIPSTKFRKYGEISNSTSMHGSISFTGEALPLSEEHVLKNLKFNLSDLRIGISEKLSLGLNIHCTVVLPIVSAVGVGASSCEWEFVKDDEPLFGKDIETWSIIALPIGLEILKYRMRFYFNARTVWIPTRRQSDWVEVECKLSD